MYQVSIELWEHERKSGIMKNAAGKQAARECFRSFFEFSQASTSVSITQQKHGEHVFYFFYKTL